MSLSFSQRGFHLDNDEDCSSSNDEDFKISLKIIFVKTNNEMSPLMTSVYEAASEKIPDMEYVNVIDIGACVKIPKADLKKEPKKIFVFDEFDEKNKAFAYLSPVESEHVYIFGSRAMMAILLEGAKTPRNIRHIHNMSLQRCVICTSSMPKPKKQTIKQLVHYMGGTCQDALKEDATHLVCEGVGSAKYENAGQRGVKIMHFDWVQKLWESSSKSNEVRLNLADFDQFKLPIFFNLVVTSTGLTLAERDRVKTLVEENGGTYNMSFKATINVLIMPKKSIGEQKHTLAVQWKLTCLLPEWIYESVKHGYAFNLEDFRVKSDSLKSSTPTKKTVNSTVSNFNPDCTKLSEISHIPVTDEDISISETVANTSIRQTRSSIRMEPRPSTSHASDPMLQKIKSMLREARKVALVLDGINVFLDGFSKDALTELNKVVTALGAFVFKDFDEGVSHVIVGETSAELFEMVKKSKNHPIVLKLEWISQIIAKKSLVSEKEFEIKSTVPTAKPGQPSERPSPSSKKAMTQLTTGFKKPAAPFPVFEDPEPDDDLIGQYIDAVPIQQDDEDDTVEGSAISTVNQVLIGKDVFIYGLSTSESKDIIEVCESLGANLVDSSYKREVDFIVTLFNIKSLEFPVKYKNLVSKTWILECQGRNQFVELDVWTRPILDGKSTILKDETLVVTNYKGNNRQWVQALIKALGGISTVIIDGKRQDIILITDSTFGAKFDYAKKNDYPALPVEWLIECNLKQTRVDERPFLIGGTVASKNNMIAPADRRESIVPSSQADESFNFYDPPIENIEEPLPSRINLSTPNSAVKKMLNELPTPVREVAKSALKKGRQPNGSPRRQVLQNTSATLRSPSGRNGSFRLRDDETPNTTRERKRRLEEMDKLFNEPSADEERVDPNSQLQQLSPPYRYKRYAFLRERIDDYTSPDPRNDLPLPPTSVNPIRLEFDEGANNNCTDFFAIPTQPPELKKPRFEILTDDVNSDDPFSIDFKPPESDNLVEWDSGSQRGRTKPFKPPKRYIFSFSFLADEVRDNLTDIVNSLKGEITIGTDFTHLITPAPSKGEKYLCGIVKGVFLLHPSYLYKCKEEDRFVDEASFEFVNPLTASTNYSQKIDAQIAEAGYRWRQWIKQNPVRYAKGAFTSFKFIMYNLVPERIEQLANVLISGGAEKVDVNMNTTTVEQLKRLKLQYFFTDPKKPLSPEIKKKLTDAGVKILALTSIFHYIVSKTIPDGI